jgi:hypothetical protein
MRASETSTNRMRLTIISTHSVGREARVLAEQHAHSMPSVLELALACQVLSARACAFLAALRPASASLGILGIFALQWKHRFGFFSTRDHQRDLQTSLFVDLL